MTDDEDGPRHLARRSHAAGAGGATARAGDTGSGPPRRRWALPGALAAVMLAAAVGAVVLDGEPAAGTGSDGPAVATPVLSARRVPEVLAEPIARRRLGADLDAWLAQSPPDSCLVVEDAGRPVFQHNPTMPLTGASTQKLITATALLLAHDPGDTLTTSLVATMDPTDGVVTGDVTLVGGGDALLATTAWSDHFVRQPRTINDLAQLAQDVADSGVTRIDGSVVGADGRYDDVRYHPSWPQRFLDQDVVGPIDALMANDGFAAFPSSGEGDAATVPAGDPGAHAALVLTDLLRLEGVDVVGEARAGEVPGSAVELASLPSLTVAELTAQMLRDSDNETAEAAIKEVGRVVADDGSWEAGAAATTQLLADAGVDVTDMTVVDGSGLSVENRLTCSLLVELLTRPGTGPVLREGLAVAGETGTLADPWEGTAAQGRLRGKTGTLRNVTALAGEIETTQGSTLTFAYVANVADPGPITAQEVGMTGLADVLLSYPRGVDVARLTPAPPADAAAEAPTGAGTDTADPSVRPPVPATTGS